MHFHHFCFQAVLAHIPALARPNRGQVRRCERAQRRPRRLQGTFLACLLSLCLLASSLLAACSPSVANDGSGNGANPGQAQKGGSNKGGSNNDGSNKGGQDHKGNNGQTGANAQNDPNATDYPPEAYGQSVGERHESSFFTAFDTVTEVIAYTPDYTLFREQMALLESEMLKDHHRFNIYEDYQSKGPDDPGAMLYRVNQEAGRHPVPVDDITFDLLTKAREISEHSFDSFNICEGAVLKLWHEAREKATKDPDKAAPPSQKALEEAAKHCNPEDLILDPVKKTVAFKDPKMQLDLGAMAKGYSVQRVANLLKEKYGDKANFLISAGGNLCAVGWRGGVGYRWRAGIHKAVPLVVDPKDPTIIKRNDENATEGRVYGLHNVSLVSSGGYERFFIADGKVYHHIIDPKTLFPANKVLQVSIYGPDSGICDALSTALFILGPKEGQKMLNEAPFKGYAAYWVLNDGSHEQTAGFPAGEPF